MRPTLHLGLPSAADVRWKALSGPMQGFDAVRLVSQILSLQSLHYLTLSFVLPPLLALFVYNRSALDFQGGVASLSLLLDWREIAGYPILNGGQAWPWNAVSQKASKKEIEFMREARVNTSDLADGRGFDYFWEYEAFLHTDLRHFILINDAENIAWEGRRLGSAVNLASIAQTAQERQQIDGSGGLDTEEQRLYKQRGWWEIYAQDRTRGWVIALAWAFTGGIDVLLLSTLIRRPTHILDHTITLHIIHLFLTWFYTRSFPTSLFYWMVMAAHIGATVVWAEALSIRREMRTGWQSGLNGNGDVEEGINAITMRRTRRRSGGNFADSRAGIDAEEQSGLLERESSRGNASTRTQPHVLFGGDEDDDEDGGGGGGNDEKATGKRSSSSNEKIEMKRFD